MARSELMRADYWTTNDDRRQRRDLQGQRSTGSETISRDGGRLDRILGPDVIPVDIPVPFRVPTPGRRMVPVPDRVKRVRDFSRQARKLQTQVRKARQLAAELDRLKRAKAFRLMKLGSRENPWALGFQLGWKIGTIIFGDPFAVPDTTVGPDGWSNPDWDWFPCTFTCSDTWRYNADSAWPCSFGPCPNGANGIGVEYTTPDAAHDNNLSHPATIRAWTRTSTGKWAGGGEWVRNNPAEPNVWTQTFVSDGVLPAPVVEVPMEYPEMWPQGKTVEVVPQRWAEAYPKEEYASEPAHRRGQSPATAYPPLLPVPVVLVEPQPGTAPSPPTVVLSPVATSARTRRVRSRWRRNDFKRSRDTKWRRSRKLHVQGTVWAIVNASTEAYDFLEAMWMGLPKECRKRSLRSAKEYRKAHVKAVGKNHPVGFSGKVRPDHMLRDLWNCWDDWNARAAFAAFVSNQIEDLAYGFLGRAGVEAQKRSNISFGLSTTISSGRSALTEGAGKLGADKDSTSLPLPVLKYDREAGVWSFEVLSYGLKLDEIRGTMAVTRR